MSNQVLNNDVVYMDYSNYRFSNQNGTGNNLFVEINSDPLTFQNFIISKLSWDYTTSSPAKQCNTDVTNTNCGAMRPLDPGTPIYYGDFITLFSQNGQYLVYTGNSNNAVTMSSNVYGLLSKNCTYIDNLPQGSVTLQISDPQSDVCSSQGYMLATWCVVGPNGEGYYGGSDHYQNITNIPLTYGAPFFLLNFSNQTCYTNNTNTYLWCNVNNSNTNGTYIGIAVSNSISNQWPNSGDKPGATMTFSQYCPNGLNCSQVYCNPDVNVCSPLTTCQAPSDTRSTIKSGQYICIYACQSALPVAISGSSDHTLGFSDDNSLEPGNPLMTFLIKKINLSNGSFYSNSDPSAQINIGEPFVIFGKTSSGVQGLLYPSGDISYPGGYNNILVKDGLQVYDANIDCGGGGSAYASWCFVGIDGTGNVSNGNWDAATTTPVKYGDSVIIQNFGKSACTTLSINGIVDIADFVQSNNFWKQDGNFVQYNTPNLNITNTSDMYPANDTQHLFFTKTYTGGYIYDSDMKIEDCTNCTSDCDVSKGCCGCNDNTKKRGILRKVIILLIILIIIIVIGLLVIGFITYLK